MWSPRHASADEVTEQHHSQQPPEAAEAVGAGRFGFCVGGGVGLGFIGFPVIVRVGQAGVVRDEDGARCSAAIGTDDASLLELVEDGRCPGEVNLECVAEHFRRYGVAGGKICDDVLQERVGIIGGRGLSGGFWYGNRRRLYGCLAGNFRRGGDCC